MSAPTIDEWIRLLRDYASGEVPGDQFDVRYFALFREANEAHDAGEEWVIPRSAEVLLGDFFVEVDCLSNDPDLHPEFHVTDEALRPQASRLADQLEQLRGHS
ncbi:MAG TPA: colicin immunity domain-containing protein [Gaiellaceae bacterium]|nr:colicin immunity domain-containing protein [Gaiellaceae bacterium]